MSSVFSNHLSKLRDRLGLSMVLLVLLAPVAQAQLYRGALAGTVVDPQDAGVADVRVVITNKDTGVSQSVMTNTAGVYRLPVDAGRSSP